MNTSPTDLSKSDDYAVRVWRSRQNNAPHRVENLQKVLGQMDTLMSETSSVRDRIVRSVELFDESLDNFLCRVSACEDRGDIAGISDLVENEHRYLTSLGEVDQILFELDDFLGWCSKSRAEDEAKAASAFVTGFNQVATPEKDTHYHYRDLELRASNLGRHMFWKDRLRVRVGLLHAVYISGIGRRMESRPSAIYYPQEWVQHIRTALSSQSAMRSVWNDS